MAAPFHVHVAGALGIITLGVWLHLFFGRGWYWRVRKFDFDGGRTEGEELSAWPRVVAAVPARNEAETIGREVSSLAQQNYPGEFSVVVVDDHSEDGTGAIARKAAEELGADKQARVVSAAALPEGWTGKVWALNQGVASALGGGGGAGERPDYYWFSDADVVHTPDTLRRLVGRAERDKLDLASLMVLLQAKTLPERALIPAFLYSFLMLYPPPWIADERARTAGAAGGCILLRRDALERIGGFGAIRGEVIDDCALARAVKRSGGRIWMGLTRKSVSLRSYGTFGEIRDLIARTAFTQLRYSALLLIGTLAGMLITYLMPVALLFVANLSARILGLTAWLVMTASFLPTVRFYGLSSLWAPLLPLTSLFYSYATWVSAVRYWFGRGGLWKGRAQARRDVPTG
jgi:hopene-associated glycosyltransferase HpnB